MSNILNKTILFLCSSFLFMNSLSIYALPKPSLKTIKLVSECFSRFSPGSITKKEFWYKIPNNENLHSLKKVLKDSSNVCDAEIESSWAFTHPITKKNTWIAFRTWPINSKKNGTKLFSVPIDPHSKNTELPPSVLSALAIHCSNKALSIPNDIVHRKFNREKTIEVLWDDDKSERIKQDVLIAEMIINQH